ncbi:MAG: hypothetical protein GYB67_13030 [Chloroflexi bacterium]|nr:hypothetical protein [Chloroflexota bacterium]
MQSPNYLQTWVANLDRRLYALLVGLSIGLLGGLLGLLIALLGPIFAAGAVVGVLAGLYILTNINAALYSIILILALIPFGTLPFSIGFTPTFLDAAFGAFLLVYLLQWMTGRRTNLKLTPIHTLIALYMLWLILSFVLGLRHAPPNATILRQFAETLLTITLVFVLSDVLRNPAQLRRLVLLIILLVGVQAVIALALYALPDALGERTLIRLAIIGYPNGGVIRYIEDDPAQAERAIGTFVDPNVLGGFLAVFATMFAPQVFAQKPVLRWRWLTLIILGAVGVALILTFSRSSMLAFAGGLLFIAQVKGFRRFIPPMIAGAVALLLLPQTQTYILRFADAFAVRDLATQMRVGEYSDALRLISRYPLTGVGFTGTPDIDIYTDVASTYLLMANQIGLVGVALFALAIGGVLIYGWRSWRYARDNPDLRALHIGFHAALIAVLINAVTDHYFFRLDFHGSITTFWLAVGLALTSSRLARETAESTVAKPTPVV